MSPISKPTEYVRFNPSFRVTLRPETSEMVLRSSLTRKSHIVSIDDELVDHVVFLAKYASEPRTVTEVVQQLVEKGIDEDSSQGAVDALRRAGVLIASDHPELGDYLEIWQSNDWGDVANYLLESIDEQYIESGNPSEWEKERAAIYQSYAEQENLPPPAIIQGEESSDSSIKLPVSEDVRPEPYFKSIFERTTTRSFSSVPLPLETFGNVLYYSFHQSRSLRRAAQDKVERDFSAYSMSHLGGFEVLLFINHVDGITSGMYSYDICEHAIRFLSSEVPDDVVRAITIGMPFTRDCSFSMFLMVDWYRTMWRYRTPRKYRVMIMDAARQAQQVIMMAQGYGLGSFMTPAMVDSLAEKYLGTEPLKMEGIYYLAVGQRSGHA
jgi:SagB-type dehydrogenase family enzyme